MPYNVYHNDFPLEIFFQAKSQAQHVFKLFLNFGDISASVSYKKVSYRKKKELEEKIEREEERGKEKSEREE